jgi:hypothetical protein
LDNGDARSEGYEDIDNWSGWRAALQCVLKLREGKATRADAWGKKS